MNEFAYDRVKSRCAACRRAMEDDAHRVRDVVNPCKSAFRRER